MRWGRRVVIAAIALAAIQVGAHVLESWFGSATHWADHLTLPKIPSIPTITTPATVPAPSTTITPTTEAPTTTMATQTTLPTTSIAPEAAAGDGPAVTVTVPAGWVTPQEAASLRKGMTYDQIVAIVGSPGFREDESGRGDGVDYLDDPVLNADYQRTRSTVAWETWRWVRDDLGGGSVDLWVTFRAGLAVEIDIE
jgi:hypothetical protein